MSITRAPSFLRRVLIIDAASSAALGLLLLSAAPILSTILDLPVLLLQIAGGTLLPFAVFVACSARRTERSRTGVWGGVVCNALWVIDTVALLLSGQVQPTTSGTVFLVGQALFVALMAELELIAVRRSGALVVA